jgi:protein TonB
MKYPPETAQKGIKGRVTLQFIVTKNGSIKNIEILKGVDPLLDAEAIQIMKLMPKWIPGRQNGRRRNVYFTMPVIFK